VLRDRPFEDERFANSVDAVNPSRHMTGPNNTSPAYKNYYQLLWTITRVHPGSQPSDPVMPSPFWLIDTTLPLSTQIEYAECEIDRGHHSGGAQSDLHVVDGSHELCVRDDGGSG
jgi:hypothetical protein